ncbi:MAG: Hsp20/alpha crystallin family protein [Desulfobacterales bacterium]
MDYIKIRLGDDFGNLGSRFEKTLDSLFRSVNPMFADCEHVWKPQMDIYESPEEIAILAEIAGVPKDELDVEINSKAVKISGRRNQKFRLENASYRLAEIQYGPFERILFLPSPVDPEVVSASYANGFLQIRLAKIPVDQPRKIPIADG